MKLYLGLLLCLGWLTLTTAQVNGDTCITVEGLVGNGCPRNCVVREGDSECPRCNFTCARVELSGECGPFERLVNVLDCRRDCVTIDEDTGCPECDETCVTCPLVLCDVFCPNGYERNEEGCQTCECVENCPVTASELVEQNQCSRECIIRMSDRARGCPMCDPECEDVEPECTTDDDCEDGEICAAVGDFGSVECVDVPSEGESCSVNDDDDDDDDVDETELEEELLAGSSFSGVVDRALIDLVGSMEVSCEDGFRCSSEGVCEPIEGPCIQDPTMPSCDDEGNYRPLQCSAVEGEEGIFRCFCAYPNGTRVPNTERRITEKRDAPDCVGIVFDPCKYTLNGQEYAARHGEDVVDFTRCLRCRCRDGEFVGCVDIDTDECDAIDDDDEPEGCEFRGRRLAHGDRVRVDECNMCGCRDGEVRCTELDCGDDDSEEDDVCDRCRRLARRVVCGTDGRTHLSRCFAQNCSGLRDIDFFDGPCLLQDICRRFPCSRGETCLRRGGVSCLRRGGCDRDDLRVCVNTTLLRCRNALSNIDETVCASNGQSYASVCRMLQDTRNVQVDHTTRCDNPECDTGPVCGTDGVTYPNLCVLRSRSANARVDHRGECDEEDDTPSDDICARVRASGRCEYNRDNCNRLVRPEEGCCPICGGVVQIALDRSRLQSYVEINPSVATLDDFIESLARAGFFPDDLDDQCEVEISLTRRSNVEIVLRARRASDEDTCFQASEMLVERANDPALALSTVPPELEFTSGAASAPLVDDGGSGASATAFSYLTLAIAYGLAQSFF